MTDRASLAFVMYMFSLFRFSHSDALRNASLQTFTHENSPQVSFEYLMTKALPASDDVRLVLFQPDTSFLIPLGAFSITHTGLCRVGDEEGRTLPSAVTPDVCVFFFLFGHLLFSKSVIPS
jgi:hypothetical protein